VKSTASNARMGKLRVGSPPHSRRAGLALAQALLVVTIRSQSSTTRVSMLNRADDYVDCDGRGLTTKFAKSVLAEP
jgi:hypothetical protein